MVSRSLSLWTLGRLASASMLLLALFRPTSLVAADRVYFDVPTAVAVKDVTTEEFAAVHAGERLVELKLLVSAMVQGTASELELKYGIDFPARGLEIVDYLPKTTLASDVAGNIGIETHDEDLSTLGIAITGAQPPFTGTLTGNSTDKDSRSVRYELLPPLETVAASGTLNRRTSAFFRMRATPRISVEGDKEFVLVLRVPATWRGSYVALRCESFGEQTMATPPFKQRVSLGRAQFVVGLYLEGDEPARAAAHAFALAEMRLRSAAARHQKQLQRQAFPTVIHKVGALLSVTDPKLPSNWLESVIYSPPTHRGERVSHELPDAVSDAVSTYLAARRTLVELSR